MRLRDWYDLTRLDHGILWGTAVIIGEVLACRGVPPFQYVVLGFVIPILIEVGIFSMNDYLDLESDILNKRADRPLTREMIPQQYPLYLSAAVLPLAAALGAAIGLIKPFIVMVAFIFLGVLYNVKLKQLPLVKNTIMGLCIAAPLVWGNLMVKDQMLPVIFVFGLAAFTAGAGREILKDMIDTVGDKANGCRTFPIMFGSKSSAVIVSCLLLAAEFFVLFPYFYPLDPLYFHDHMYFLFACAAGALVIFCVHSVLKDRSSKNVEMLRKRTLTLLEMGMVTFVAGVIF